MLLIGSEALRKHGVIVDRKTYDKDYICTYDEYRQFVADNKPPISYPMNGSHMVCKFDKNNIYEFEIAWEGSSAEAILKLEGDREFASLAMLRLLKESHKYKRNSPHFIKTMNDVKFLRNLTKIPNTYKEVLKLREKETYNYSHPNLNQSKSGFFTDSVKYLHDHDSIHRAVKILDHPAYTYYMKDGEEVFTSKDKFFSLPEEYRLYGVLEESYVLALERSQIPNNFSINPRRSFDIAISKVCTSITSGWFRKYAYDNYEKVVALYNDSYVDKFKTALDNGLIEPFQS